MKVSAVVLTALAGLYTSHAFVAHSNNNQRFSTSLNVGHALDGGPAHLKALESASRGPSWAMAPPPPQSSAMVRAGSPPQRMATPARSLPHYGGLQGSTNLPSQYAQMDPTSPYYKERNGRSLYDEESRGSRAGSVSYLEGYHISGPANGGPQGSTYLPSQYAQIDHTSPYHKERNGQLYDEVYRGAAANVHYLEGLNGPANGGIQGSPLLPAAYERIDAEQPYSLKSRSHVPNYNAAPGHGGAATREPRPRLTSKHASWYYN